MWKETTDIHSDDRVEVTTVRDFSYTRYAGALLTDLNDGSLLQKYYFTTNGVDGTRFVSVDYQGISLNTFPMMTNRGTQFPSENPPYQIYTFEYGRVINLAPWL